MYGMPLTFSYKKNTSFKTTLGGLVTILTRLLILVYVCYEASAVYYRYNKIVSKSIYEDMSRDKTQIYLKPDNFDIAISV